MCDGTAACTFAVIRSFGDEEKTQMQIQILKTLAAGERVELTQSDQGAGLRTQRCCLSCWYNSFGSGPASPAAMFDST